MKTTVIFKGEPVEAPSFHADRLIRAGKATLPRTKGSVSVQVSAPTLVVDPPADPAVSAPPDPVKHEAPDAKVALESDATPAAKEPKARRGYTRRDMKAQD